jgi:hypothetical protein
LIFVLVVLWPAAVQAATTSDCSASTDAFARDLETNTTRVDDLASPNSPSPDHIAQSAARYNRDVDYYSQLCPASKKTYADALLATWKAWLEHATNHSDPIDATELAARKLEKCAATYSGTDSGTTCATWQKQVKKWQDEWGTY